MGRRAKVCSAFCRRGVTSKNKTLEKVFKRLQMLLYVCKLATSPKSETGYPCSCCCSWELLPTKITDGLHFSQQRIQYLEIHLSEPQGSNSDINTSMTITVGLALQLGRLSDPEGPFPTSVWVTAMLTISFIHVLLSDCNASGLILLLFQEVKAALPPLGRPHLQHPVIIWWAQLSASLLQKSMLTASRWPSEEWWLIGSNTCRGT